jgi:GNAT superfamily N-acetyltransferase
MNGKGTINCEKVAPNNLELAIKTQNHIFPNENGALNLKAAADAKFIEEVYGKNYRKSVDFWICKDEKGEAVGITGIYAYVEYPEDAWCGWFGIVPEKQGIGYGKELFAWTIEKAKEMGFKNFRLYTDLVENDVASELYRKVGMIEEEYTAEDMGEERIVIFSKSLISKKSEGFGNKNLFLKKQEEIQKRAQEVVFRLS